jgi:hypothetical protein
MSKEEIKSAINELLDNTDEQVLNEVLNYLKSIQGKPKRTVQLSQKLRTILDEDKELLQRLAK